MTHSQPQPEQTVHALLQSLVHHCEYDHPDPDMTQPCRFTDDVEAALNHQALATALRLIGENTQTHHDDNGLSDFANADINIAINDLINWINIGQKIDRVARDSLKNKIIARIQDSRKEEGANQLRQQLRQAFIDYYGITDEEDKL